MAKLQGLASAGFKEDMETLLQDFVKTNNIRFTKFAECWRQMKFSLIFCGMTSEFEIKEFLEDAFIMLCNEMLSTRDLPRRIGAFYMAYSLFEKQPTVPKIPYRLSPDFDKIISNLVLIADEMKHFDVVLLFERLINGNGFYYVATELPMGPVFMRSNVSNSKQYTIDIRAGKLKSWVVKQAEELGKVNSQYVDMKRQLNLQDELDMIKDDFYSTMVASVSSFYNDQTVPYVTVVKNEIKQEPMSDIEESNTVQEEVSIGERRRQLKRRAIKTN